MVAKTKKQGVRTKAVSHDKQAVSTRTGAREDRAQSPRSNERPLPRRGRRLLKEPVRVLDDRSLPREVELAIHDAISSKRRGPLEPVTFEWFAGIYVCDKGSWRFAFKKNTRPGLKQLAHVAALCDIHAVQFSVFVEEPRGMLALDVLVDVPTASRDGVTQRACIRLEDNKTSVDLVLWLETYMPKVVSPAT